MHPGRPELPTEAVLPTQLVPSRPPSFTIGGLVARTFATWWRSAIPFTVLSLLANAPVLLLFFVAWFLVAGVDAAGTPRVVTARLAGGVAVAWAVGTVLSAVLLGAVTFGTLRRLQGSTPRLGDMLGAGIRRGLPVVGVGFVFTLAVLGASVLLVVPGVVVALALVLALPAAVVERRGILGSFRRSRELTRGRRLPLLLAFVLLLLATWALAAVVQLFLAMAAALVPTGTPVGRLAVTLAAGLLSNGVLAVIPYVGLAVAYHDLRLEKDGVDTSALASVFE